MKLCQCSPLFPEVNISSFGKWQYFQELNRSSSFWKMIAFLLVPSGYSPTIKGQLLHVDTTSSMQYRTLLEAEMLAVSSRQSGTRLFTWRFGEILESYYISAPSAFKERGAKAETNVAYAQGASKVNICFVFAIFLVPCDSQLPPGMEHAPVVAVWDWSVQGHVPFHLRPEKLLHWWAKFPILLFGHVWHIRKSQTILKVTFSFPFLF